ncbi:MAG: cytochrome-c peroxidase, partial [Longimicrobiales bacterium]
RRRPAAVLLAQALLGAVGLAACEDGADPTYREPEPTLRELALAAGLRHAPSEPVRPVENPYDADRVELGHLLFFDPITSGPQDVACSTCHLPRFGLSDGRQFPAGAGATGLGPERTDPEPTPPLRLMPRNSLTTVNLGLFGRMSPEPHINATMFWGGQAFGLEDQVLAPIAADNELRGMTYSKAAATDSVVARLRTIPEYVDLFRAAYPMLQGASVETLVTPLTLRRALAAYLRELITDRAPIDRFLAGEDTALTALQKEGLRLFTGEAGCAACHAGPLLSDFSMHVLGVAQQGLGRDTTPGDDIGWAEVGGTPYAFRTPQLRQVTLTAPYFHAGTAETLDDVIRFKNAGVSARPDTVTPGMLDSRMRPLGLTEPEIAALVALMAAFTDTLSIAEPLFVAPPSVPSGLIIPK